MPLSSFSEWHGIYINEIDMEKEDIIKNILSVCNDMGVSFHKKVKTDKWKADIVVDYQNYKVAFNVCKNPRNIEETYTTMRKERVCGCWLVLSGMYNRFSLSKYPCFPVEDNSEGVQIHLSQVWEEKKTLLLSDFVSSLIQGKIRYAETMKVKYVDVRFYKIDCWKCGRTNDAYFVYKTISENGIETEGGIDIFNQTLVKGIRKFVDEHRKMDIALGEIKPRYSKTVNDSYMSFGCKYCDSLFGNFFINGTFMDVIYSARSLPKALVEIDEDMIVNANCWYKLKI